ncbi:basic leucine zipper 6-like [Zingiber officinale]|uniref:BZIP domain-containing protein n=1 Tax=Zingiber officinale TaxID=94328 RepID=A0A8J5ERN9_ZINOF|nr:basic leucine zipper 6-like [Zingiber officinale]XP_042452783.1 basic leucine zipper 6-like [Zingiber officinale]KAG6467054.1 hypothetical protein ZIOFF_075154 [Zingiber officinale]
MSRPASLPPRCPLLSRGVPRRALDSRSHTTQKDDNLCAQEPIFPSHESPLDEQPVWLNDLLAGHETSTRGGMSLRRSSSDPVVLLDVAKSFHGSIYPIIEEDALSDGFLHDSLESEGSCEVGYGFEAGNCVYGPNSPRQKGKLTDSESSMIASLLENAPTDPLKYLTVNSSSTAVLNESLGKGDYTPMNPEAEKITRRHSGQRSRVRKLQYIAELERNIDLLQTLAADFASRVASLFQYRLDLSVENKKLRQQIASLGQEKLIKEGLHQSLKNEAERLRMMTCGRHRRAASCFEVPSAVDSASVKWPMPDFGKMSLGGSQSSLKHSFG